ncbi:MAG TPA: IS630 family transposase [Thermoanaerobaculia bacterium]|nr:IS630 family transposase [Thermoanaerobaculia bacterium]
MRIAASVTLSEEEGLELQSYARGRSTPARVVFRAKVILLAAEGKQNLEIASILNTTPRAVGRWRQRFVKDRISGILQDAPRPGRPPKITPGKQRSVVRATLEEKPPAATQWSTRTMAKAAGISESSVRRIWKSHGLRPHRVRTFKLSNDPRFTKKLEDIVGLYLNPPEHAIVLSVDEKSQIQALDRTQPGLPMKKGRCGTMTHDYKRHGTTTLFAALNTLDGKVLGACMPQHRHQEWLRFLRQIDREVPKGKDIHLICDNYATHKHPKVKAWLAMHPRFHCHFTPTSSSWLNMVERFFRDLTVNQLRRGVFHSVTDLNATITDYLTSHNAHPKPFVWTAKAADILEKVKRARRAQNKGRSV